MIYTAEHTTFAIVDAPPKPQPSQRPALGWEPGPDDRPFRVGPDDYDGPLKYTNATTPVLLYNRAEGRVTKDKVIVQLHERPDWQAQIELMNNYRLLELFISQRFGFCDTGSTPEGGRIPYTDNPIPWGTAIDCALNLRNCKEIIKYNGNKYALVQTQDYNAPPNPNITWDTDPQLTEKQVDYGTYKDGPLKGQLFYRTSEVGDLVFPFVSPAEVAHQLIYTHFYPGYQDLDKPFEPFQCLLYGFLARVVGYCFTGSDTWVQVDGGELEAGWYWADGYEPKVRWPEPGKDIYYVCNVSGVSWPQPTPPVAGGRKE